MSFSHFFPQGLKIDGELVVTPLLLSPSLTHKTHSYFPLTLIPSWDRLGNNQNGTHWGVCILLKNSALPRWPCRRCGSHFLEAFYGPQTRPSPPFGSMLSHCYSRPWMRRRFNNSVKVSSTLQYVQYSTFEGVMNENQCSLQMGLGK